MTRTAIYPHRNDHVQTVLLPDGYVTLINKQTEWAHTWNPPGAIVWEFSDGRHSVSEILTETQQLLNGVGASLTATEIQQFFEELIDADFLHNDQSKNACELPVV